MRILHALTQTELTGSEVFCRELSQYQSRAGHELRFVLDEAHLDFPGALHLLPLSHSTAQERKKIANALLPILREFRPQVIHCHSRGAARHLVPLARRLRIPVLSTLHGRQHFSLSKLLSPRSFGDHISVICENLFQEMREKYRFPSSHLHLIRNPISFSPSASEIADAEIAPPHSFTHQKIQRLGWVGRASGPKGNRFQHLVEHLFPTLLQKYPGLQLQVLCSNLSGSKLKTELEKLQSFFPGRVQMQDNRSDLRAWYRSQNWVLGGGRVAMEALAEGCQILVLGEHSFLGRLNLKNWAEAVASNFGDIGLKGAREQSLDLQLIARTFDEILGDPQRTTEPAPKELKMLKALLRREFDAESVFYEFERITRLCFWEQLVRGWIPCLMYHKVSPRDLESPHKTWITQARFEEHLKFFKKKGFTGL
ncbi:MAG: glycosyltransferase, partial [Bdellovibrio sp.]